MVDTSEIETGAESNAQEWKTLGFIWKTLGFICCTAEEWDALATGKPASSAPYCLTSKANHDPGDEDVNR